MAEEIRNQDEEDAAQAEFFQSMKPKQKKDMQQILAWFSDMYIGKESVRCGSRVMFDLTSRNIILETKVGDEELAVTCPLKAFAARDSSTVWPCACYGARRQGPMPDPADCGKDRRGCFPIRSRVTRASCSYGDSGFSDEDDSVTPSAPPREKGTE